MKNSVPVCVNILKTGSNCVLRSRRQKSFLSNSDALRLEHKQQLQKFLEHSDLVKFARYEPNPEQINESLTMAEEFVEKTKSEEHRVDVTQSQQTKGEVL